MTYLGTLKKYWYIVAGIVVITCVLTFVISIVQTPKYESKIQILIIQKHGAEFTAVTAARSAEAVANVLTKVVITNRFLDDVLKSGFNISREFPTNPEERIKAWKKTVEMKVTDVSGILEIKVFDEDRDQAEQIVLAITYVLISKGEFYHGGGKSIEIKMIEEPVTSNKPVKPDIPRNVLIGFIAGMLAGCGVVYLIKKPEKEEVEFISGVKKSKKIWSEKKPPERVWTKKKPEAKPEIPLEKKPEVRPKISKKEELPEEVEKYTPEKIDRWIKTGKFE